MLALKDKLIILLINIILIILINNIITMSDINTGIGKYLGSNIAVKLNPNYYDLPIHKCHQYIDARIGCSLCAVGIGFGFKLNISDFVDLPIGLNNVAEFPDTAFNINDLNITGKKYYEDIPLHAFYLCKDISLLSELKTIYAKFDESEIRESITYDHGNKTYSVSNCGISSCFVNEFEIIADEELENMEDDVRLCPHCYYWLNMSHNFYDGQFVKISAFDVFWRDFVRYDLDIFIFNDPEDEKIVKDSVISHF